MATTFTTKVNKAPGSVNRAESGTYTYYNDGHSANTYIVGSDASAFIMAKPVAVGQAPAGDKIFIEGVSAEYTVKLTGNLLVLTNGSHEVKVQIEKPAKAAAPATANTVTDELYFLDGKLNLEASTSRTGVTTYKLGGVTLANNKAVDLGVSTTIVPTASDLALDQFDSEVSVSGYKLTGDSAVLEGNSVTFTVTRTGDVSAAKTLVFNVTGDTNGGTVQAATSGVDVTPASNLVTFAAGSATATFTVAAAADTLIEGLEGIKVTLFDGASVVDSKVLLVSDDPDAPESNQTFTLTAAATSANEGATATFNLTTTNVPDGTIVPYTLSGVTSADVMGGQLTGNAVVNGGVATITVNLINDNATEGAENLVITLDGKGVSALTTVNDTSISAPVSAISDTNGAEGGSVAENSAAGTAVGITALATDANTNDTVTYSLTTNPGNLFAIDASTGVITVANPIDYETATSYSLTVKATSTDGSTSYKNFTVAVTNVNDNAVSVVSDTNTVANTVAENLAVGSTVGITAHATDADAGATVTYSLSDNAGGRFAIDANTGVVTLASALDYETATSHNITVVATSSDGSAPVSQVFTINVTNVNDNALSAVADNNVAANAVDENASVGSVVGITARATDADSGATVTYALLDNAGGRFAIDANTGVVTVANALDYETNTVHAITVQATSTDGDTQTQVFNIAVNDIAETVSTTLSVGSDTPPLTGSGNDTFDGRTTDNSLNTDDVLQGGTGTDTVTADYSGVGATYRPTLQGIENVDVSFNVAAVTLDLANADNSLQKLRSNQSTNTATFTNVGTLATVEAVLTPGGTINVGYTDTALAGGSSAATLKIDNSDGITVNVSNSTPLGANRLETLNVEILTNGDATPTVTLTGADSYVVTSLVDATTTAYTINADNDVDARALNKGVNINITSAGAGQNVQGGNAGDALTGNTGIDTLIAGTGDDTLTGGLGTDSLNGGEGSDTYVYANGEFIAAETLADNGTAGTDVIQYTVGAGGTALVDADFANKTGVERLTLMGADNGGAEATLDANAMATGIRTVDLAASQDVTVTAGFTAGLTVNTVSASAVVTGSGDDTINLAAGANTVDAGGGADTITLGTGADDVDGEGGNDTIVGGANVTNADTIIGGLGTDELRLAGVYTGGAALSAANLIEQVETITLASETDTVGANNGYQYSIAVDDDNDVDNGVGTADVLTVNASALLADADSTQGGAQAETLVFTAAGTTLFNVSVTGGAGDDDLTGGTLNDTLIGGAGADTLDGGAGADSLVGGEGADNITGGANNDTINLSETVAATDTVVFSLVSAASNGNGNDTINNFDAGAGAAGGDVLDFSAIVAGDWDGTVYTDADFLAPIAANDDVVVYVGNQLLSSIIVPTGQAGFELADDDSNAASEGGANEGFILIHATSTAATSANVYRVYDAEDATSAGYSETIVLIGTINFAAGDTFANFGADNA